jgi:hypothetical protein
MLAPQFSWEMDQWKGIIYSGYYYQWHELFDKPSTKILYDGYYRAQHYFSRFTSRYYLQPLKKTSFVLDYQFRYIEDWATESNHNMMIYQSYRIHHDLLVGISHRLGRVIEMAAEGFYNYQDPDRRDYLAQVYRRGDIISSGIKIGINYSLNHSLSARMGFEYHRFQEDEIWNYFGNNEGPVFSVGAGYYWKKFEIDGYFRYGKMVRDNIEYFDNNRYREKMNLSIQFKSYL